jgi:hypothetical protein
MIGAKILILEIQYVEAEIKAEIKIEVEVKAEAETIKLSNIQPIELPFLWPFF